MYSNSNSYLGGVNSARPAQPQYGQSSYSQAGQLQGSGIQGGPLQQQYTGYPAQGQQSSFQAQQQQPQFTGYPPQNQQAPQNQTLQQQHFQTGASPQVPQKTGQTSSQIAASFSSTSSQPSSVPQASAPGAKIPKIRLSFLTATDQAKFEQLFKSAVGDGQALDGRNIGCIPRIKAYPKQARKSKTCSYGRSFRELI